MPAGPSEVVQLPNEIGLRRRLIATIEPRHARATSRAIPAPTAAEPKSKSSPDVPCVPIVCGCGTLVAVGACTGVAASGERRSTFTGAILTGVAASGDRRSTFSGAILTGVAASGDRRSTSAWLTGSCPWTSAAGRAEATTGDISAAHVEPATMKLRTVVWNLERICLPFPSGPPVAVLMKARFERGGKGAGGSAVNAPAPLWGHRP